MLYSTFPFPYCNNAVFSLFGLDIPEKMIVDPLLTRSVAMLNPLDYMLAFKKSYSNSENAETIIRKIVVPNELGKLIPAREELNGPSGKTLDDLILKPLDLDRKEAWLCDLVPHSCVNPSQSKAIKQEYLPIASKYGLSEPSVPSLSNPITAEARRNEIINVILESEARILILLGDLPILWFLSYFDKRWTKLSDFGLDNQSYGRFHDFHLGVKEIKVLPIAHPRQIAKLGQSSVIWFNVHAEWVERTASKASQSIKAG